MAPPQMAGFLFAALAAVRNLQRLRRRIIIHDGPRLQLRFRLEPRILTRQLKRELIASAFRLTDNRSART
jgi:hypothetical protein